ncbi:MAG: hypothetical protein IPO28_15035 [Holophagaceae bacterium]|nr:hypothetical protein [Holophagaceae bacterium]
MTPRISMPNPLALIMAAALVQPLAAVDLQDTRLVASPALSARQVAFLYAGDLWTSAPEGGAARRLTTRGGCVGTPLQSRWRVDRLHRGPEGNADVWVIPAAGGVPRRLTWHPSADVVQDWTPDSRAVLFTSGRSVHTTRFTPALHRALAGGMPTKLPIPNAARATYSPDGGHSSTTRCPTPSASGSTTGAARPHGSGSTASRTTRSRRSLARRALQRHRPHVDRRQGLLRVGPGRRVQPLQLRPGDEGRVAQLTKHADFPILAASHGAGRIVYEQAGWLHSFDPATGQRA